MKTVIGIVILGVVVGGIYFLNDFTRSEDGKSLLHVARELEIAVETAIPEQRGIIRTVQAPGEVEACAEVDISSEVVAKILELPVEEGDWVEKGQLLCRLDDADYRARVLSAQANVARLKALITQAEADLEKAERDYARQKEFIESDLTSSVEMANYRTVLIGARAIVEMRRQELVAAEAALQSAREDLEKTVIRSPLSGVVSQLFAEQGEVVITGTMNNPGTRVMVISDLSKMQVRCRVDEADAPLVAPDQVAHIYLQSDTRRSVPGGVLRVGTKGTKQLGRDVVTFETLVLISGDDQRVKPGMSANVEIEVARDDDALTIPVQAVVYRKRRDLPEELLAEHDRQQEQRDVAERQHQAEYIRLVFCTEDGKAYPRLVETGINDADGVQIVEGIAATDTVVIGPYRSLDQLKDGSPVKPLEKPGAKDEDAEQVAKDEDAEPAAEDDAEPAVATSGSSDKTEDQAERD
ncbi:MAG: efflux RND transporter periplasmic adaptor subunit [Planctomycetes bacterium]|nr:efflux RND transporter periplasmic adaptor subunit [Planctomycetota bacterium]